MEIRIIAKKVGVGQTRADKPQIAEKLEVLAFTTLTNVSMEFAFTKRFFAASKYISHDCH